MVRNTNKIHGILRLSNHPNLIQVVFPDLLFDERKCYFTVHHVKRNNPECETSI